MLEYALISATVVVGFAVAGKLGVSDAFLKNLSQADSTYNIVLPSDLDLGQIADSADSFNAQISLR
jgi:hypothetical protein